MSFLILPFLLIIVCFIISINSETHLEGSDGNFEDCTSYNGSRPLIFPLDKLTAYYSLETDPRSKGIDPDGKFTFNNAQQFRQFNCTYNKPIRWIFQLDPLYSEFNLKIDFSQRTLLDNETEYSTNFKILYFTSDFENSLTKLFSCEVIPVGDYSWCERNFIQVFGTGIQNAPVNTPDNSLEELEKNLLKTSIKEASDSSNSTFVVCKTKLLIKVERGNVIKYRWEGSERLLTQKFFPTNESIQLENTFRLTSGKDPGCTITLPESDLCSDCTRLGDKNLAQWNVTSEFSLNAVTFYGKFSDGVRIHKGHFSVPQGGLRKLRKFYFISQMTSSLLEEEMVQLEMPTVVYKNLSFEAICRVSVFQISYGTIISALEEPLSKPEYEYQEFWKPHGFRDVKKIFKLNKTGSSIIRCLAPLKHSDKWVEKSKNITVEEPIPPTINSSFFNSTEFHKFADGMKGIMIDCNISGNPMPEFYWNFPEKVVKTELTIIRDGNFNRIIFPKWKSMFAGTYQCKAVNRFGHVMRIISFENEEGMSKLIVGISSSLGAFVLLSGIAILILSWKIRKQRLDFEKKTQKAIEEFKNGLLPDNEEDKKHANFSVLQLPYNEGFEVSKDFWKIEEKILGSGQFGVVRLGSVTFPDRQVKIAVKTLKSSVEIDEFKSFLFELKIMAFLGQHKNIVSLVAACTEGINDRDILIGVEFCDNGCLLNYLRKHRAVFRNMVTLDGKIVPDTSRIDCPESMINGTYVNISSFTISTYDLYRWAYHIASGMEYLRAKKVLHGDLAARNVLLSLRKVAKVGDFGLSRVLMNSENYTKTTATALPWKWMSIESLRDRVFSANSDMWSYGITLTELFTLGQSPYPGMSWSPEFIIKLEHGMRMERPAFCTSSIYKLMRSCWDNVPSHRPTYQAFKRKLAKGLRRLSILSHALPPPQGQTPAHPAITPSTNSSSIFPINVTDEDVGSVYSNLQRSAMNYYKNS